MSCPLSRGLLLRGSNGCLSAARYAARNSTRHCCPNGSRYRFSVPTRISSVAYATEEILLVAGFGGAAYLSLSKPIAAVVALLLVVVVASYRQTVYAYPSGGGAFVVSLENLGQTPALGAAAALLVDYVMTVAVSVVAGVVAITSAVTSLSRTPWCCRWALSCSSPW